jgi:hypothetical protein
MGWLEIVYRNLANESTYGVYVMGSMCDIVSAIAAARKVIDREFPGVPHKLMCVKDNHA